MQKLSIYRGILNCIILAGLFAIGYELSEYPPFKRGFHCNDESIKYPYKPDDTVNLRDLLLIVLLLPVLLIVISELCFYSITVKRFPLLDVDFMAETLSILSDWFLATCISFILESFTKLMCGRWRPMFMEACKPNVTCNPLLNDNRYITNFYCTTEKYPFDDLGRSFPSGHSSESMLAMSWLALYFHKRYQNLYFLRYVIIVLQLILITLALFVGFSRIQDYRHHWSDVLGGMFLGLSVTWLTSKSTKKLDNLKNYKDGKIKFQINSREMDVI